MSLLRTRPSRRYTLARRAVTRLVAAARAFDGCPASPASLGVAWRSAILDACDRRAARDPGWASEDAARRGPGGVVTVARAGTALTAAAWLEHLSRGHELAPEPWYAPVADALARMELRRPVAALRDALDRQGRGFTDPDVWDLTSTLARRTGMQLVALADGAHGWPSGPDFPYYGDWVGALRERGAALVAYADADGLDALLEEWDAAPAGSPEREAAWLRHDAREEELRRGAADAYRWVADHHASLWD